MQGTGHAVVTPSGVRDGDPAALAGLVDRRGSAVLAFCDAVCAPDVAPRAAAEAFARFRAAVAAADDASALNPETLLLGATRHAAASMARTATGGGGIRRRLGAASRPQETCALVPTLLAARAEDMLGPADQDRLTRHLERCAGCREIEAAFRRAERAYRSPPERPIPSEAHAVIMAALAAAVPAGELAAWPEPADDDPHDGLAAGEEAGAPQAPVEMQAPIEAPTAEARPAVEEPPAPEPPAPEPSPAEEQMALEEPTAIDEPPAPVDVPAPFEQTVILERPVEPEPAAVHQTLPDAAVTAVHAAVHLPADASPAAAPTALPRPRRHFHLHRHEDDDHGPVYRYVLPGAAIAIAIIVAMAVAGVFGGDEGRPARTQPARGNGNAAPARVRTERVAQVARASATRHPAPAVKRTTATTPPARSTAAAPVSSAGAPQVAATPAAGAPAAATPAPVPHKDSGGTGGTAGKTRQESSSLGTPTTPAETTPSEPVYDAAGGAGAP